MTSLIFIPQLPSGAPVVLSQFSELITTARSPVLTLNGALPLSELRNVVTVAGGASVDATTSPGEIRLALPAAAGASAILESRQSGSYTPGYQAEIGFGIRRPVAPAGDVMLDAGLFDGTNGFIIRENSGGLSFLIVSNSVITEIAPQALWNIDPLDGSGRSGLTLDLSAGAIAEIDFTYYGYGAVQLSFVLDGPQGQAKYPAHVFNAPGLSVQNPNLPVWARIENGGSAAAFEVFIGGRQYSVVGRPSFESRITSASRLLRASVGTTYVPLVSFQPRVTTPRVQYTPDSFDTIGDADHLVSLWLNPTLTDAVFGAVPDVATSETLLEVDVAATAMASGVKLWEGLAAGSGGQNRQLNTSRPLDVGSRGIVTLAVRRMTGINMTVSGSLRVLEKW